MTCRVWSRSSQARSSHYPARLSATTTTTYYSTSYLPPTSPSPPSLEALLHILFTSVCPTCSSSGRNTQGEVLKPSDCSKPVYSSSTPSPLSFTPERNNDNGNSRGYHGSEFIRIRLRRQLGDCPPAQTTRISAHWSGSSETDKTEDVRTRAGGGR